ncbi:MAG: hypothetical protein ABI396_13555 [Ktedonobacteraceae bacterium]
MSSNANDCSMIEQRIDDSNLYISTTQDQINKLEPDDPDVQNKRDALTRKLDTLHGQVDMLRHALEDCRQGKGANLPPFDIVSEGDAV